MGPNEEQLYTAQLKQRKKKKIWGTKQRTELLSHFNAGWQCK